MTCERCQAEQERAERIATDLHSAEQELRAKRREIGRLKAELKGAAERDPSSQIVTELLDYWRKATGHEKAKIPLDGIRAKNVRGRLKDHTPGELKESIEGYARFPFVRDAERVSTGDALTERFDDAELIFRNEKTVQKGVEMLARFRAEEEKRNVTPLRKAHVPDAIELIRRRFGWDAVESVVPFTDEQAEDEWWSVCPLHPTQFKPLIIRKQTDYSTDACAPTLELACLNHCDPQAILAALHCSEERVAA